MPGTLAIEQPLQLEVGILNCLSSLMPVIMPPDEQWCFRPHHLRSSPSKTIDSLPLAQELRLRAEGVHFLLRIGAHLMLKVSVLATAAAYFHRFYMRHSIKQFDRIYLAAACLFLACKVEESTRKLKDVAAYCWRKTNEPAVQENEALDFWQERILSNEEILLEALCFDLIIQHPHQYLAEAIGGGSRKQQTTFVWAGTLCDISKATCELAWSITNDSLRTPLVLFHSPRLIACGCFLLAFAVTAGGDGSALTGISENSGSATSSSSKTAPSTANISAQTSEASGGLDMDGKEPKQALVDPSGISSPIIEGENMNVRSIDDILRGQVDAGKWKDAFQVSDDELDSLSDVIGHLLDFYRVQNMKHIQNVRPPRRYTSIYTLDTSVNSPARYSTSNSSPATTLVSGNTPMHRVAEETVPPTENPASHRLDVNTSHENDADQRGASASGPATNHSNTLPQNQEDDQETAMDLGDD